MAVAAAPCRTSKLPVGFVEFVRLLVRHWRHVFLDPGSARGPPSVRKMRYAPKAIAIIVATCRADRVTHVSLDVEAIPVLDSAVGFQCELRCKSLIAPRTSECEDSARALLLCWSCAGICDRFHEEQIINELLPGAGIVQKALPRLGRVEEVWEQLSKKAMVAQALAVLCDFI